MDILPGAAAQPLHRDDGMYSGMGGLPYPHLPLTVNTVITLDEFTPVNGATRIVPGSMPQQGRGWRDRQPARQRNRGPGGLPCWQPDRLVRVDCEFSLCMRMLPAHVRANGYDGIVQTIRCSGTAAARTIRRRRGLR